jgi:hypothetical protein
MMEIINVCLYSFIRRKLEAPVSIHLQVLHMNTKGAICQMTKTTRNAGMFRPKNKEKSFSRIIYTDESFSAGSLHCSLFYALLERFLSLKWTTYREPPKPKCV